MGKITARDSAAFRGQAIELAIEFASEAKKAIAEKNKSAARRARKTSVNLEQALKAFRKASITEIG